MRWPVTVAVALLLPGCASLTGSPERGDVLRRVLPSAVQLRAEREEGGRRSASGVVIASSPRERRSWILTTRHFLEPDRPQQIYVSTPRRQGRVKAEVLAVSPEMDLAVIKVEGLVFPPVRLKDIVQLGDEVWVVGFPWGQRLTLVGGIVSQVESEDGEVAVEGSVRMVDASVSYGSSGGGVFDAGTGDLVGIVEGYRTARLTLQRAPERVVDIPVPGETTVLSSLVIRKFLVAVGLEGLLGR